MGLSRSKMGEGEGFVEELRRLPADFMDVVLSWSIEDIFDAQLYKRKVEEIPQTFQSVEQYLGSFVFPLLEETRVDFCSSLEKISDAPNAEIIDIKERYNSSRKLMYGVTVKCWKNQSASWKEKYRPLPGDILIISHVSPESVSDLNFYGSTYSFASIIQVDSKDDSHTKLEVGLSRCIDIDGNMGQSLYAIYLFNITTNKRIWRALNRGYGLTSNMGIIEKVLHADPLANAPCDLCPADANNISADRFPMLNDSQVGAILSSLATAQCNHRPSVQLIWGPPGTGKTRTISELLLVLLSRKFRVLTCAPTNVAISEVASRVLTLIKNRKRVERGRISCYSLGDTIVFGNNDRLKIGDDLREIYLDYRVGRLLVCLSPLCGWMYHFSSMIKFLEGCVSLYQIHLESQKEQSTGCTFAEFVTERCTSFIFYVRSHVVCLCTHLTVETLSAENFEILNNLLNFLEHFGYQLASGLSDEELKKCFWLVRQTSDSNLAYTDELLDGLGKNSIADELYRTGREVLYALKFLRKNLHTPSFRQDEEDQVRYFCLESASLVFCTASSSFQLFFKKKSIELKPLDLLLIDEGSQLKESESAIPLQLHGIKHTILIGDQLQLPATVKSEICEKAGFGRSLFERLSSLGHPKHLLEIQYRMCPAISLFPNTEFYYGQIKDGLNVMCKSYEKSYLSGKMYGPYSFINVDGKEELDEVGHSRKNLVEVGVVLRIVRNLFNGYSALKQKISIGILSPYAAQVAEIHEKLGFMYESYGDFVVNVKSIDGCQGGEEDVIIISTVRSNSIGAIGFLSDRQRANVALTRARHCLWIIGNGTTLMKSSSVWESLVLNAKDRQCFFNAGEDKTLAAAILHVKKELDQMEDMLNEHSVLFVNSIWRVLFSDDFKKSFARIRYSQTKMAVMNFLLKLSSGWRPKKYNPVYGSHMQIVKEYKVVGFYVICTTDIKKLSGYTQVLKIWDIKSLSETPELVERLNTILLSYSEEYINLCKARCFDGNLEVPVCWDVGLTVVKFKTLSNSVPCEGSDDSESDGRIFVENSKVSESLLLMKFYSLSSGVVAHLLSSCDGKELDLPFEVSDQEHEIIVYPRSTFILGRSGTGKTTVLSMKLIQKEQQWHLSSEGFNNSSNVFTQNPSRQVDELVKYGEENFLRQMFVTVSAKLCSAIKNHILRLKSFTCGGDFPPSGSFDMYDIADSFNAFVDIPNSFGCIPRKHYPLVITFEKFLIMLDGTMEKSFFEKFHEFGPSHDKTGISNSTVSHSLIRQKEVTYARFTSLYWPHFNIQLTRKLNPSTVFTEIISHIKGGVANGEAIDDFLSRESYCGLSEGRASTLNSDERNVIYDIFLDYEKKKMVNGEFDWSDFVIDLNYRLKLDKQWVREKMDFVYVDEVQDLTMGQISLFRHVCNNFDEGFVFAGDTAQTIARGIDFRFQDIRSLYYNEFHLGSRQEAIVKNKRISDIFHLNQNFRTHDGVLKLAQSVVDILYRFFPQSVDRLSPETSLIFGEAPVLLESGNDENAIMTIFGNRGSVSSGDYADGFGAEQAIIVRDDNSKIEISDLVKKQALVLTIIECKGLEFQDVLLYNFFKDSPLKNQFRVIYDYMQSQNLLDSNTFSFPQFEIARHNILCSELKQLYVAITRTRQRLWICDSNSEYSKPMIDYWKKLCLVRVRHLDSSLAQAMCVASSKEEWRIRGIKLFNEGNFEMATMCFEKATDSYREKWARASGLRVSAKHLLHSNFEMARVQFTESAELYDSIGKPELAASCYFELKDFRKAGTIYLEKCGDSMLESAGDCFSMAGCSLHAAEVYAKGKCFSKCLSVCSTGNLFDMGLKFIEFWKDSEKSLDLNGNNNEMDELKDSFLEKCAVHYHVLEDRHSMMKVVESFSSAEHARTFLKSRSYLTELLEMEERLGNFIEAASIARLKRDLVLEAKMLEKAGQFEKASELVLFHVVVSSLWISGNKGWPMKQFIGKEDLLEKAKSMAERSSDDFYSSVCLETGALGDKENSLADFFNILEASRRIDNIVAEIFSSRKALDMHFRADPSKFIWKTKQYTKEILLQNELSTWTLIYMWKSWEEKITHMLLNLKSFETHTETVQSGYWDFCLKYFGVQVNDCQKFTLFNPEAYWLKEKNPKILKKDGQLALDAQQFASAAMSYWSSELFSVGVEVVDKLKSLDNFIVRKSMSALYRGEVLVHIFEVSRILLDSEIFGSKSYPKLLQARNYSKWNFFNDIIFSIDWRLVSKETVIALRDHDLSVKLLKEILVECINRISVKVTYGNVGKVVMLLFATGKLDEELRQVIGDCSMFPYPWNMFIKQLRDAHSGFEKLIIATNLKNAMKSTFESNWLIEPDYISPQCFLYLAERLLLWLSSCRGNHFITTRALLMESLSCSEHVTPGFVDNRRQIMRDEAFNILMNMITQILFDKPATMKWVKKFDVNTGKYYSMLMLRSVVVASLFYLNSGLHFQLLSNSLRRKDITSELPGGFYHCLRNLRKESFLDLFASALVTIDDPLVIVSSINGPDILCPHALFVKVGPVYDRDDILGMLSQNNHGFGDQSDGDGVKHEISGNVGSSKDSSQGNKTVDPVLIPDKVENLEASTLKEKYTNLCLNLDLLLSEYENDDTVVSVDPQVKSNVDEFVVVLHDAIRCLDQANLQDGDKLLLRETNTIIDMLKQLSIALDTRENELESDATMREELLDQIREKMPKVQAFLALLEVVPAAVAVVQHDKDKETSRKPNDRKKQKGKKKKGKK